MNLHWLDWTVFGAVILGLIAIAIYASKYNRSVGDFLAASRLGRRYLMCVAGGFGGAISLIAAWEVTYMNGLPTVWWSMMLTPLGLFIALTGFVTYRFRETRALTLAQFFEQRYSRGFRLYSGTLCWVSGVLNYGIFPQITTKFIIMFLGLPPSFHFLGMNLSTRAVIMFAYLALAVFIAWRGGQIAIMITDFFQGSLLMIAFLILMFFLLAKFGWADMMEGMRIAPEGKSLLYPMETANATDFNIWYYLISVVSTIYCVKAWQGTSGYNAAAISPHESVMSGIIGSWRGFASTLVMLLMPMCAYAVMHLDKFKNWAALVNSDLAKIPDAAERVQMIVPSLMSHILPIGLGGLFAVVILACAISCDDTYVHAWGTIFIQDVVMPFRKKPFEKKHHMLILRLSILGVAIFAYCFSMLFPLKDSIMMYFAITGAIYMGGAGSVIIGGLYWKRGSTPAAWAALTTGTVLGLGGIIIQQIWQATLAPKLMSLFPNWEFLAAHADKFPINSQYIYLITMVTSILVYVLVSLLGPRHVENMDKLLHRGEYADEMSAAAIKKEKFSISKLVGINSNFTRFDRFIAYATSIWSLGWWLVFIVFTVLGVCTSWLTHGFWEAVWWWKLIPFSIALGTICTIWIMCGGIRDAIYLFRDLKDYKSDDADNGFVADKKE